MDGALQILTRDDDLEGTSCDIDIAVFDVDEVIAWSRRSIRELIPFVYLGAADGHLRRPIDENS